MAHVTGLVTRQGLGLIRCERCGQTVDAADACVGTLVTGDVNSSVLLCSDCAQQDTDVQAWLVDHLTAPDAPEPGCDVA